MKALFLLLAGLLFVTQNVLADEKTIQVDILTTNSVSWDNTDFQYPSGKAKITIQKITIRPKGKELSLSIHCHVMPLAAYVTKGSVKVVKLSGETKTFSEGEAFVEVMGKWHRGTFDKPSELIVFYAGNHDMPLSIKKDGDSTLTAECEK